MITVFERSGGLTIGIDGHPHHVTKAEADDLRAKLSEALRPVSTAITPAKYAARVRPPIQRYPVEASK